MYKQSNRTTLIKLCEDPCSLYKKFIFSHIEYLKFMTVVDLVPSVVACKIYYNLFVKYNLLKKAKHDDYQYQYLEINKKIYTKYINFKKVYVNKVNTFLKKKSNIHYSIGIHYRVNDMCFNYK